jgi:hypothetical protein
MSANPPKPTWSQFYFELHAGAERLRELMQTADSQLVEGQESAAKTASTRRGQRKNRIPQNERSS